MTANSVSFMDQLKESGLLAEAQLSELRDRIRADTMEVCISGMMERGWLTEFQVRQLHAGQSKGLVLGQYHLLEELGRGGYGCVYKAKHKLMERIVALKVMAPELVADPRARTWFRREVLAATHLNHPNIALAFDANEVNDILFFAMEFIDGFDLDTLIRQRGPLPIGMACELALQAAKALQYAHEKEMVHRDIKPANLLIPRNAVNDGLYEFSTLSGNGNRPVLVKVVDFGLARLQKSSTNHTLQLQSEKSFVGTPAYVSPEQARNVHDVDIRSDLYSLGCTLYYAIAGHAPFRADTPLQLIVQHLEKEAEPLERARPEIPPALASIVRRLMVKKREKRFQTPAELIAELGFFYNNGFTAPTHAASIFRVESPPAPAIAQAPMLTPKVQPIGTGTPPKNDIVPTMAIPGLATDMKPALQELARTAAIDRAILVSENVLVENRDETRLIEPLDATTVQEPEEPTEFHSATNVTASKSILANTTLIEAWREWMNVIARIAAGLSPDINTTTYQALHQRLVAQCEAHRDATSGDDRRIAEQVLETVKPWVSLESLPKSDRAMLASLISKCSNIDRLFGKSMSNIWSWVIGFVLLSCFFVVVGLACEYLLQLRATTVIALVKKNPVFAMTVLVPTIGVLMIFLLKRIRTA